MSFNQHCVQYATILSAIDELYCPICLSILRQPIQLPCERLVCALCLVEWIHLRGSRCPCCFSPTPLECTQINPASRIIQLLLKDVMVLCAACKRSVKAVKYDTHCRTEEVKKEGMQLVTSVLDKMLGSSKKNCIHIPTGGTVSDKYYFYSNSYVIFTYSH